MSERRRAFTAGTLRAFPRLHVADGVTANVFLTRSVRPQGCGPPLVRSRRGVCRRGARLVARARPDPWLRPGPACLVRCRVHAWLRPAGGRASAISSPPTSLRLPAASMSN